ncbi:hypothetical protein D1AOALGA4SA_79 [Olavius algarvensis Delta 1 endosymbiont]|nr:hypothetical protein D1AOALGA4SA_79 [Olavius algarvensis Delta 1 endosymbiont]
MNPPVAHRILCNLNYKAFFMPLFRDFCDEIFWLDLSVYFCFKFKYYN